MNVRWIPGFIGALLAGTVVAGTSSLQAQTATLTSEQVAPQQVEGLVRSLLSIQPLLETASRELQLAQSPVEEQAIERQFVETAADIVQQEGLTVGLYSQLMNLANQDPEFRDRVAYQLERFGAGQERPLTSPNLPPSPQTLPLNRANNSPPSRLR
ncbi:MAG: DUF4168 domain-containing protein [Synechococcus sp.]